jgi:hypothetical protein
MMPYNIRIIEDNRNNRTLLWDILTFNGYEVSVAIIQEAFRS